jgi:hypothetical protein
MNNKKHYTKIKMMAYNTISRKFEEIHPEDEVPMSQMVPMFMGDNQKYYTAPDYSIKNVYAEWRTQQGK